jgi:hypothetical protein
MAAGLVGRRTDVLSIKVAVALPGHDTSSELVVRSGETSRAAARRFAGEHSLTVQAAARLAAHIESSRQQAAAQQQSHGSDHTSRSAPAATPAPSRQPTSAHKQGVSPRPASVQGVPLRDRARLRAAPATVPRPASEPVGGRRRNHTPRSGVPQRLPARWNGAALEAGRVQRELSAAAESPGRLDQEPAPEPATVKVVEIEAPAAARNGGRQILLASHLDIAGQPTVPRTVDYKVEKYRSKLAEPGLTALKRNEYQQKLLSYQRGDGGTADGVTPPRPERDSSIVTKASAETSSALTDAARWAADGRPQPQVRSGSGSSTGCRDGPHVDVGQAGATPKQVRRLAGLGGPRAGGGRPSRKVDGRLRSGAAAEGQRPEPVSAEALGQLLHQSRRRLREAQQPWSQMDKSAVRGLQTEVVALERLAGAVLEPWFVGDVCTLAGAAAAAANGGQCAARGRVAYLGRTKLGAGLWVGVILDDPVSTVAAGRQRELHCSLADSGEHFSACLGRGVFVSPNQIGPP